MKEQNAEKVITEIRRSAASSVVEKARQTERAEYDRCMQAHRDSAEGKCTHEEANAWIASTGEPKLHAARLVTHRAISDNYNRNIKPVLMAFRRDRRTRQMELIDEWMRLEAEIEQVDVVLRELKLPVVPARTHQHLTSVLVGDWKTSVERELASVIQPKKAEQRPRRPAYEPAFEWRRELI